MHAIDVLTGQSDFTVASLISAAFDSYLPAFARLIPILIADYDTLPADDPRRPQLAGPVALLRPWDHRWGIASMPTTLAVFWGDTLWDVLSKAARAEGLSIYAALAHPAAAQARVDAPEAAAQRSEESRVGEDGG